jgi:hypothetical protein
MKVKKGIVGSILSVVVLLVSVGCAKSSSTGQSPSESAQSSPPSQSVQSGPPLAVHLYGPVPPIVPGGPRVEATLTNASGAPVISAIATLDLGAGAGPNPSSYTFDFGLSSSSPLLPGKTVSQSHVFIGAGFNSAATYPVRIRGSLEGGTVFDYTVQANIGPPPS